MFVHWNHASVAGRELSWPLVGGIPVLPASTAGAVPVSEYYASVAQFCPEPGAAKQWCALAHEAGMQYAVLTTKHHDGFAMWPTATTEFSIAATPYRGDLVGEFADAARAEGLRVGLYFSLSDWHHPDYPAFTDDDRPYASVLYRRPSPEAWERFVVCMREQLRELLTGYGAIDVIWFDGGWERTAAEWRASELETAIRSWQPDILINDRLPTVGDYATPEQFVPAEPPAGRWETCLTMNRAWGYCPDDRAYKPGRALVHTLCEVAGRGGNLLLNVSPRADGSLPDEQVERLETIARWMARHREAITATRPGLASWQWYGPSTRRGDRWYAHLLMRPYDTVTVRGVPIRRVRQVVDVASGTPLHFTTRCPVLDEMLNADPIGEVVIDVPPDLVDDLTTVLALDITP